MSRLIVLAHFGEAQSFVQELSLVPAPGSSHFFESEEVDLLLCGEGPLKALMKTMKALGKKKYDHVINAGVAGALKEGFEIGEVFSARTLYHSSNDRLHYQSFSALRPEGLKSCDVLSSDQRLFSLAHDHPFRAFSDLVDREVWGIAQACSEYEVPLVSIKVVSDIIGNAPTAKQPRSREEVCKSVLSSASAFSEKLLRTYQDHVAPFLKKQKEAIEHNQRARHELAQEVLTDSQFLWTHSLENQLFYLLQLSLRKTSSPEKTQEWLKKNKSALFGEKKNRSRKENTKHLLLLLEAGQ